MATGVKDEIKRLKSDENLPKFDDTPIRELLQEKMPKIDRSPAGRLRLIRALSYRFGEDYKTFEAPSKVLKHFDDEVEHLRSYIQIKRKSYGR